MSWFIASITLIVMALVWWLMNAAERADITAGLGQRRRTWLALFVLIWAPTITLAPLPGWLPRWWLLVGLGFAWAIFVAVYWQRTVVPAINLQPAPLPRWAPPHAFVTPATPIPGSQVPEADGERDEGIRRTYRWHYTPRHGMPVEQTIELELDATRYAAARAEPRRPVGDWAHYAQADMPELDHLAASFYELHKGRAWTSLEQASNVLCFTQRVIRYEYDADSTPAPEWPRYPIETLVDGVGDCEDDVILAAAVLKRLGFEVALLYYPGHCALGVAGADHLPGEYVTDSRTGLHYFYGETTAKDWRLGVVPVNYRGLAPTQIEPVHRIVDTTTPIGA